MKKKTGYHKDHPHYVGFTKLKEEIAHKKGVKDAGAIAASIGRKKYGKANFQKHAAAGKSMRHAHKK